MRVVEVNVTTEKFGNYKKGDILKMEVTTARACQKKKAVKIKK